MGDSPPIKKGILEGSSRILRELLRTPKYKKTIRILLNELDPKNAPLLVRVMATEDSELFLSFLSASPAFINTTTEALSEFLILLSAFSPGLLTSFLTKTTEDIDAEKLGETVARAVLLGAKVLKEKDEDLQGATSNLAKDFWSGFKSTIEQNNDESLMVLIGNGAGEIAKTLGEQAAVKNSATQKVVTGITDQIKTFAKDNPEFIQNIVAPIINAGKEAIEGAKVKPKTKTKKKRKTVSKKASTKGSP